MKITIGLLIYTIILTDLFAYNFNHFSLKGDLKQIQTPNKGLTSEQEYLRGKVNQKLLGKSGSEKSNDRYNDIFARILEVIGSNYDTIGGAETGPLLLNHQMGGGVVNFSGFTWQKPFANFRLYANRELAPDLYQDRWIVHDSLTIAISASTLLTNMRDLDLIDISDSGLAAFAGLGFSRTYHYYHFSSSWAEGLQSDYSKLFLSFTQFNSNSILQLAPYHLLKKQDAFLFNAGGFINVPVWNGLAVQGGVLVSKSFENTLTLQSLGADDNPMSDEFLRVSIESESKTSADAHLSAQLDFFNILKLTLLSYDLEYSVDESNKIYLSFFEKDRTNITNNSAQFSNLIKGKVESVDYFSDNIVQKDQRYKENLNSKFYFLLLGSISKTATEQIKVVKDGIEKIFFRHYAESKKVIQDFWSKILGTVIQKIFNMSSGIANSAEMSKKMEIEYEYEGKLAKTIVNSEEKFSVKLTQYFYAKKTNGFWKRYYRKKAVSHIARYTHFDMSLANLVSKSEIRGPMDVVTNVILESNGLRYFNQLSPQQVMEILSTVCNNSNTCINNLKDRYNNYYAKLNATGTIDLMQFKSFLGQFYKSIRSNYDFYLLFGVENVFINGSIHAVTDKGQPFQNFFKAGQFKGLGVIDDFMRGKDNQIVLPIETN